MAVDWVTVGTILKAVVDYVMTQQKEAAKARELAEMFTSQTAEIIQATRTVIKGAFAEERIITARNQLQEAVVKIQSASPTNTELNEAVGLCESALTKLDDPDTSVLGFPFYVGVVGTAITVYELLDRKDRAYDLAERANVYFRTLRIPVAAASDSRFALRTLPPDLNNPYTRYTYTIDGIRQLTPTRKLADVVDEMTTRKQNAQREALYPLFRSACLWHLYKSGYTRDYDVAFRGANNLYMALAANGAIVADEDSARDPMAKFEVYFKDSWRMFITPSGLFLTVAAVDSVAAIIEYVNPLSEFTAVPAGAGKVAFKSKQFNRFLNVQPKNTPPVWVIECQDDTLSESTKFQSIRCSVETIELEVQESREIRRIAPGKTTVKFDDFNRASIRLNSLG